MYNQNENTNTSLEQNNINDIGGTENKYDANIVSTTKFNSIKWNMIEKPLNESEKKRNQIILKLGENISTSTNELTKNNITVIGDYYYQIIKSKLSNGLIEFPKQSVNTKTDEEKEKENKKSMKSTKFTKLTKSTKSKEKQISSTLKAKLANIMESINKKLDILIKLLEEKPETKIYLDLMNNLNYIEFRIIILMKIIHYYTKFKKEEINEVEELVLGSKKILKLLKDIKKNKYNEYDNYFKKICNFDEYDISLSNDMINDLEQMINNLTTKYGIKLVDIANTRPKLIFDTKYDETIPNMKLKPYDSQIELSNIVNNNITNGFMIFYKTLPGLGKTSMILSICSYIKKSNSNLKVIFCCSDLLESVRVQVLRTVFNFGIKFGIASSSTKSNEFRITNSWNCPKDDDRELIVADYKSTYLMLKESEDFIPNSNSNKSKTNYLLFFDEPTVLTDQIENESTLSYLSKILYYIPSHAILSSATLPMLGELEPLVTHYKTKFPNGLLSEVISNKTLIGCVIKDFDSNQIVPHSGCKTQTDLKNIIQKIKNFPLLGKFYTLPFLMNLNNWCMKYGCSIDLDSIETFDQDSVLENILVLLNHISNIGKQNIFDEFIGLNLNDIRDDIFDTSRLDIDFNKIEPSKFLTAHAFKYIGCCLIATSNPLEYTEKNLYSIVDKLKNKVGVDNINKKYVIYLSELSKYNEQIDKIKAKYTSDDKIDEEVTRLKIPKFEFDKRLEINTEPHIKSFAKYVKAYDSSMTKSSINFEKINITEYNIDDNLKFLLYMGVGLFSKDLDSDYTNKVLEMLQNSELAYIIADESFCYGANYLISNVIINDDIGDPHSINTILQLIGRTARVGKSWSGKVYLDTNTSSRIKDFFLNPSFTSIEGTNIIKYFLNISKEIEKEKITIQTKNINKNTNINESSDNISSAISNNIGENVKVNTEPIKIIKSGAPIGLNKNPNSNLNQMEIIEEEPNEIYTWRRGRNFKSEPSNLKKIENQPQELNTTDTTDTTDTTNSIVTTDCTELWTFGLSSTHLNIQNQQLTQSKPNQVSMSEEWGGLRGKNKLKPKPELFVPKSFDELNVSKSNLTPNNNLDSTDIKYTFSSNQINQINQINRINQTNQYEQFNNINMFKKSSAKQSNKSSNNKKYEQNKKNINT